MNNFERKCSYHQVQWRNLGIMFTVNSIFAFQWSKMLHTNVYKNKQTTRYMQIFSFGSFIIQNVSSLYAWKYKFVFFCHCLSLFLWSFFAFQMLFAVSPKKINRIQSRLHSLNVRNHNICSKSSVSCYSALLLLCTQW